MGIATAVTRWHICERCRFYRKVCSFDDHECYDREWLYGLCEFYSPAIPIVYPGTRVCPHFSDAKGNRFLEVIVRFLGYADWYLFRARLVIERVFASILRRAAPRR